MLKVRTHNLIYSIFGALLSHDLLVEKTIKGEKVLQILGLEDFLVVLNYKSQKVEQKRQFWLDINFISRQKWVKKGSFGYL
jgi:hypothetical protein